MMKPGTALAVTIIGIVVIILSGYLVYFPHENTPSAVHTSSSNFSQAGESPPAAVLTRSPAPALSGDPGTPVMTSKGSSGLTFEEERRIHPPPPRNLRGTFAGGRIELSWDAPERVTIPHNYNDSVRSYTIYRGTTPGNLARVASTPNLLFSDRSVYGDTRYVYEITAMHEGSLESVPSEEIVVWTRS